MQRYTVVVRFCGEGYATREIVVKAMSSEEAKRLAYDRYVQQIEIEEPVLIS